jgi:hypothetical protein
MKQTVNFNNFCDAFRDMGRNENFSHEGKHALFDYLVEIETDMDKEIDLDVIALCCEYSEDKIVDILQDYNIDSIEELGKNTSVIMVNDTHALYRVW